MSALAPNRSTGGFTLVEVVMAIAICGIGITGIVAGYLFADRQAALSGYSLAAQNRAAQQVERLVAARWDTQAIPVIDELVATNFPGSTNVLDGVISGLGVKYCTNLVFISVISADPPLKLIRVETTWSLLDGIVLTNTIFTYRAPDQ